MMKIVNILTSFRNHPKKTIVFGSLFGFGIKYGNSKYEEECLMRRICEEASKYGEVRHNQQDSERHITVLLNPAANNNKCKKNYEKYCAPLLHLAGIKVALVRTEHEGQAKEIMEIMENTNAVVIAGGDGTLQEVLTGLLRREDSFAASQKFPLGILPLGNRNMCASTLWGFDGVPKAEHLAQSTMDVVKGATTKLDVMEITPIENDSASPPKPVYAATNLEWSAYRDAQERNDKYWYWGPLKKYTTYIFSSYRDLSWNCDCSIGYSYPCSGCQKCKALEEQRRIEADQLKKMNARWWHSFVPRKPHLPEDPIIDYSEIVNENCGEMQQIEVENVSDIKISCSNTNLTSKIPGYALAIHLGSKNVGTLDFIKEGFNRSYGEKPTFDTRLMAGDVLLEPKESCAKNKEGNDRELNIDHSTFEVKPMKLRALRDAVTVFASRNHFAS